MPRITRVVLLSIAVLMSGAAFGQTQQPPIGSSIDANSHVRVDVTRYGARGDGKNDDKDAITAASTAACRISAISGSAPELFFPPGVYRVTQPQAGESAIFTPTCAQQWTGSGYVNAGTQFVNSPSAYINVDNGPHPVDVPVLQLGIKVNGFSTYGLTIQGYKRTLAIVSGANFKFPNTTFSVNTAGENSAGDCPITVSNALFCGFHWHAIPHGVTNFLRLLLHRHESETNRGGDHDQFRRGFVIWLPAVLPAVRGYERAHGWLGDRQRADRELRRR